jgi:tetratricopeptide (TPR) repeat protein
MVDAQTRDPATAELADAVEQHRQGAIDAAMSAYESILARDPANATALRHLGLARFQTGKRTAGIDCLKHATRHAPADAAAWSDLGRMLAAAGETGEALACFRRAVETDPRYTDGWHNLGAALRQAGEAEAALAAYKRALVLDPARADTYLNIGNLLVDDNQTGNAIESFKRAARLDPKLAKARAHLAAELSGRGDVSEAELVFRQAVALNPDHEQAWFGLGRTLEDLGHAAEAVRCYRRVLDLKPLHPWALGQLLGLEAVDADDDLLAAARDIVDDASAPDRTRALIGYGLGKALDRRGEYDAAFAAFHTANAARRREAGPFDRAEFERRIQRLIDAFPAEFFAERRRWGLGSDLPVFIVGMPRSGTTLTEQILDRHPRMSGAGELPHLAELAAGISHRFALGRPWPECASELAEANVREGAHEYLDRLRARTSEGALRVSDKSPLNFHHLGLAALMFPNARVVHCRRDPIDTCLSIYFEHFRGNQTYATDLDDIAAYYRGYERLMAHWRDVLPLNIREVRYEDMVTGLELQARGLVEFTSLPWDNSCLSFHQSERAVQTPSRWQVRKPIYGSSVARWRRYERYLAPLTRAFPEAR